MLRNESMVSEAVCVQISGSDENGLVDDVLALLPVSSQSKGDKKRGGIHHHRRLTTTDDTQSRTRYDVFYATRLLTMSSYFSHMSLIFFLCVHPFLRQTNIHPPYHAQAFFSSCG